MIRTADYKYVQRSDGGPNELYDLRNDPEERTNLIDGPDQAERTAALRERLFVWCERYAEAGSDPVGHEYLRPRRNE